LRKESLAALLILMCAALPAHGDSPKKEDTAKPAPTVRPAFVESPGERATPEPAAGASPLRMAENPLVRPLPAEVQQQTVIPEVSTQVSMSSSDANRIVCSREIKDVIFSGEKGVSVKVSGRNAFVKFRIQRKDEREIYSSTPTEIFVVCGESVYNLIAVPRRIPAQTVRLSQGSEKIGKNAALYGALPFEKKLIAIVRSVYTGEIPDGYSVAGVNRKLPLFRDLDVTHIRSFRVEGEGLSVSEFSVSTRKTGDELNITEKDFLRGEIAAKPVAITIDRHTLKQGETARVIVVEQAPASREGGDNGVQGQD
jgi:conjugal transfer pilus assembly protein TraK